MERNIAALMRSDTRTCSVAFVRLVWSESLKCIAPAAAVEQDLKLYTYITDLPLQAGDTVVVLAGYEAKLVQVMSVDDELKLEPNDSKKYSWVVCKVDATAWLANQARNKQIEDAVADAYRNNLRKSFAQQINGA